MNIFSGEPQRHYFGIVFRRAHLRFNVRRKASHPKKADRKMHTLPTALTRLATALLVLAALAGCDSNTDQPLPDNGNGQSGNATENPVWEPSVEIPGDELPEVKVAATLKIVFSDDTARIEPASIEGVTVERNGAGVTITSSAPDMEYRVSGATTNGFLKIYSDAIFSLTLAGADITNPSGPAVNIQSGKHCFVTLADGTTNTLADGATYASSGEDQKATLFSEGELVFGGGGALTITARYKHAIYSDDYVVVRGGTITTTSTAKKGHAVASNGNIIVSAGALNLTAGGAAAKGLNAGGSAVVTGGEISITTTGDAIVEDNDTTSPSGIKADVDFVMSGGSLSVAAVRL